MDQFWLGAGGVASLALIGWIFYTEWRIKKLTSSTLIAMEKLKDEKIVDNIKNLSDAELDALLAKDLSAGNPKT